MSRALPPSPFLYAILDAGLLAGRSLAGAVAALARGGAGLLQLRAKDVADAAFVELAREAVGAAHGHGLPLVVNDRPDVARIVGADGVHVGQEDVAPADVRRLLPDAIVGCSTHDLEQLASAPAGALDYVALGPVFATRTKKNPDPAVGLELVRRARAATRLPLVAIGGITADNARSVIDAGADAVAVISALLAAADLEAATRALAASLGAGGGIIRARPR